MQFITEINNNNYLHIKVEGKVRWKYLFNIEISEIITNTVKHDMSIVCE